MTKLFYSAALLCVLQICSVAQTYSVLHSFNPYPSTDGNTPLGALIRDTEGNLYGTTYGGGDFNYGTVYKVDSSGNESILYSFTGATDGAWPSAGLIHDEEGNVYGTASSGGQAGCGVLGFGCGVVFRLSRSGKFTVLHTFTGGADGADPVAALVRDEAGNLYGTAAQGGFAGCASSVRSGCGTVFKLSPEDKLTVLHRFTGTGTDGGIPLAGLILDETGNLYGTASVGGSFATARCVGLGGCGTIFRIGVKGKFFVLYSFLGSAIDGATPAAELIRDSKGNLYGASNDGANYSGEIFKLSPAGHETVLYSFAAYPSPDGASPSRLVRDAEGNFYGTAAGGGTGGINSTGFCPGIGCGTVFELDPSGNLTVLADLGTAEAPGSVPKSGVILDSKGNLYGVGTGTNCKLGVDCGEVFKIAP